MGNSVDENVRMHHFTFMPGIQGLWWHHYHHEQGGQFWKDDVVGHRAGAGASVTPRPVGGRREQPEHAEISGTNENGPIFVEMDWN